MEALVELHDNIMYYLVAILFSIGSIISVAATALFLHIVYLQLVMGKAVFGYAWALPQLFSDYLRILKDKSAPGLEWTLHNPPKPRTFTSLPL